MTHLEREEQEILEAFEQGKLQSVVNLESELKKHQGYASETFKKHKGSQSGAVRTRPTTKEGKLRCK